MPKHEKKDSNSNYLNSLENEDINGSAQEKQKKSKIQSQLAQKNRSRGRSPNKKYG
jgi:hypothetical protein